MALEIIEAAIRGHIGWVHRFRAALAGSVVEEFDLTLVSDDTACALGKWLAEPSTLTLMGNDYLNRTVALHGTFHEIAGEVVASLRANDPKGITQGLVEALVDLSKSLIEFLEFARRQLSGSPREWQL